jgi:hypothetical protein
MSAPEGSAAPASGTANDDIPSFEELAADPEIAALLDFEPVVRKVKRPDGWTDELQRELIARIAYAGTLQAAVWQMSKHATGAEALYKTPGVDSFRAAWDAAIAIGRRRNGLDSLPPFRGEVPGITRRTSSRSRPDAGPLPGQVMNEHGEWEDEDSYLRRAEEAKDSICMKLLRIRRLYLREISQCPGKRAAFEILTELPIDWEKAKRLEPQPDEPWNRANQRQPDMILTAENGWSAGELGYGPNRMAELREALNDELVKLGKPPIDWSQDGEDKGEAQSVRDRGAQAVRGTAEHHDDEHSASELRASSSSAPQDKAGPRVRRV